MINYNKADFLQNGFEYMPTLIEGFDGYIYKGNILSYTLFIDENNDQVSISGDTKTPFSSESMYEFYVPCVLIKYMSEDEVKYRDFQFLFYRELEPTIESLVLTVSGRQSDVELVVWPYFKWHSNQQ